MRLPHVVLSLLSCLSLIGTASAQTGQPDEAPASPDKAAEAPAAPPAAPDPDAVPAAPPTAPVPEPIPAPPPPPPPPAAAPPAAAPEPLAGFSDGTAFLRSADNQFQLFPNGRLQVDSYFYKSSDKIPNNTF